MASFLTLSSERQVQRRATCPALVLDVVLNTFVQDMYNFLNKSCVIIAAIDDYILVDTKTNENQFEKKKKINLIIP
jgi:hypothetical protein